MHIKFTTPKIARFLQNSIIDRGNLYQLRIIYKAENINDLPFILCKSRQSFLVGYINELHLKQPNLCTPLI